MLAFTQCVDNKSLMLENMCIPVSQSDSSLLDPHGDFNALNLFFCD